MGFNSGRGDAERCEKRRDEKEDEGDRDGGWESLTSRREGCVVVCGGGGRGGVK